jgi:hypothetical protein
MKAARVLLFLVPLMALPTVLAQDKKDDKPAPKKVTVATDPNEAGIDFLVQGEYVPKDKVEWAAQVVARGGGKFDVYFLEGGLPGAGWDAKTRTKATAVLDAEAKTATIKGNGFTGTIALGEETLLQGESENAGKFVLIRTVRKSPTLGAKPPEGAKVLFDGASADAWKEGKIVGELLAVPATSKQSYKITRLHVEFVTPFMPYAGGQGRGNSGVYVFGHEIQVLDSFGLEGKNNECGGFYGRRAPDVNMCLPPLSWQTYDVEINTKPGDPEAKEKDVVKFTVFHNGVKIHDGVDLKTGTSGGLHLQNHGNPVFYRNIWLVEAK